MGFARVLKLSDTQIPPTARQIFMLTMTKMKMMMEMMELDPLVCKSMLLAAATATFAGDTHLDHPTPISIRREIPLRN